jgi:hypothetical protein
MAYSDDHDERCDGSDCDYFGCLFFGADPKPEPKPGEFRKGEVIRVWPDSVEIKWDDGTISVMKVNRDAD